MYQALLNETFKLIWTSYVIQIMRLIMQSLKNSLFLSLWSLYFNICFRSLKSTYFYLPTHLPLNILSDRNKRLVFWLAGVTIEICWLKDMIFLQSEKTSNFILHVLCVSILQWGIFQLFSRLLLMRLETHNKNDPITFEYYSTVVILVLLPEIFIIHVYIS